MAWAPDYVTLAELKAYLAITDSADDAQIALAVTAASRAVDKHCGRQFGNATGERVYTATYDRHRRVWRAVIDDLITTNNLVVEVAGTAVTGYTLEPRNAVANGKVWTEIVFGADATGTPTGDADELAISADPWGWSAVPSAVKLATLLQGSRFMARRESPYGVAGSPELGNELRLLARVDPDVAVSLRPYVRDWWVA